VQFLNCPHRIGRGSHRLVTFASQLFLTPSRRRRYPSLLLLQRGGSTAQFVPFPDQALRQLKQAG
jgi:hypothetical protein